MPDRQLRIAISFSFIATVAEETLRATLGKSDLTPDEIDGAFAVWKTEQLKNAKRSFCTGNTLANDNDITITSTEL
jgi:hypothetical protein